MYALSTTGEGETAIWTKIGAAWVHKDGERFNIQLSFKNRCIQAEAESPGERPQIVYGLLCTREALPIAIEVFEGNTADPTTLKSQIDKVKSRFGIKRVVLVGDRGMISAARIRYDPDAWIWTGSLTCVRRKSSLWRQTTVNCRSRCSTSATWPRSQRRPFRANGSSCAAIAELAKELGRKREALLVATEQELARGQSQARRKGSSPRTAAEIGLAVGSAVDAKKMAKHFALDNGDGDFCLTRKADQIGCRGQARWQRYLRSRTRPERRPQREDVAG